MNYFVEGVQGAGKSTLVGRLAERMPDHEVFREGDYSPVELAWCAYLTKEEYDAYLEKYAAIAEELKAHVTVEPGESVSGIRFEDFEKDDTKSNEADKERYVLTYTRILTDIPGFHKDLENHEIYNGRVKKDEFENIILTRYSRWHGQDQIFECSIFQNIVEDQILYEGLSDDEIIAFYQRLKDVLGDREYKIVYLEVEDIATGIDVIRKERVDPNGNEMWFPLMMEYLKHCPLGEKMGWKDVDDLVAHLEHRKSVELRILREVFPEHAVILKSKDYDPDVILKEI